MLIKAYQSSLSIRNYQPASLCRNVQLASKFMLWIGDVDKITAATIEDYLIELKESGRAIKTIKNHRGALKVFCDFLACRGYLEDNPVLKIPSFEMPEEIPVCLTDDEIIQAYGIGQRYKMLCEVTLALNTGLRMEEMRQLLWHDIDLGNWQIIVRKAKGKRPRTVPLNEITRKQLVKQKNKYNQFRYVFPGAIGGGHIKSNWNKDIVRGASWWNKKSVKHLQILTTLKELPARRTGRGWHALRHTFATRCIKAGIDVVTLRDWMGHRKIDTTMRYIHVARHYDKRIELL